MIQVQTSDLFVQQLWQHVDAQRVVLRIGPQRDLGQHLVRERVRHDERGMTRRATEIDQPTLGEDEDRVPVREEIAIDGTAGIAFRLDAFVTNVLLRRQPMHIDLEIEVANVADDGVVPHLPHVLARDDVAITGGGDEDVCFLDGFFHGGDFIAFHAGLQCQRSGRFR